MSVKDWKAKVYTTEIDTNLSANDLQKILLDMSAGDAADIICEVMASNDELIRRVKEWIDKP